MEDRARLCATSSDGPTCRHSENRISLAAKRGKVRLQQQWVSFCLRGSMGVMVCTRMASPISQWWMMRWTRPGPTCGESKAPEGKR